MTVSTAVLAAFTTAPPHRFKRPFPRGRRPLRPAAFRTQRFSDRSARYAGAAARRLTLPTDLEPKPTRWKATTFHDHRRTRSSEASRYQQSGAVLIAAALPG